MARFSSPREALRVYFAARRGPRASKPRWDGVATSRSYRPAPDETWVTVGHMLHAGCGVEIDSPEEKAVRRWVDGADGSTWVVRRVRERMRDLLIAEGLIPPPQKVLREELSGVLWSHLGDVKSPTD